MLVSQPKTSTTFTQTRCFPGCSYTCPASLTVFRERSCRVRSHKRRFQIIDLSLSRELCPLVELLNSTFAQQRGHSPAQFDQLLFLGRIECPELLGVSVHPSNQSLDAFGFEF